MSLTTLSLLEASTVSASGGTALDFTTAGGSTDKNKLIVPADTDLREQRSLDLSVRRPRVQASAPNGYTQGRSIAVLKFPHTLANGNLTVDTIRIEMSTDVETSVANKSEMMSLAAQTIIDSEMSDFWKVLSAG